MQSSTNTASQSCPTRSQPLRPEQQQLFVSGGLLVLSGLVHLIVWFNSGESWTGAVSWRKPILFGLSGGVTLLSIGWVIGELRRRRGDGIWFSAFGFAMLAEVGLITLQQWRGVPSHFNTDTAFDTNVLQAIEWLIIFATVVITDVTLRTFGRLFASPEYALAIRGGMLLLLCGCWLGFMLVAHGNEQIANKLPPERYGQAGVMKFPHGVPLHAIQILPLIAWALGRLNFGLPLRYLGVLCGLASISLFTIFSLAQTFTGHARFDLTPTSTVILGLAAIPPLIWLAVWSVIARAKKPAA